VATRMPSTQTQAGIAKPVETRPAHRRLGFREPQDPNLGFFARPSNVSMGLTKFRKK